MRLRASKLPRRWSVWKRKAGMEPRTHPLSLQEQCWLLRPHRKAGFQKRGASVPADAKAVGGRMMNGFRVLPATLPLASVPALSAHPVGLHGLHSQPAPQLWSPHVQQVGPAGWAGLSWLREEQPDCAESHSEAVPHTGRVTATNSASATEDCREARRPCCPCLALWQTAPATTPSPVRLHQ